jgi:hypothetical protein
MSGLASIVANRDRVLLVDFTCFENNAGGGNLFDLLDFAGN